MSVILNFWLPILAVFTSWELGLLYPQGLWYYLIISILGSGFLAWRLAYSETRKRCFSFSAMFVIYALGAYFWFLWLDFNWFKFLIPLFVVFGLIYLLLPERKHGKVGDHVYLSLFLTGTFFWSTVTFGLLTVLGWPLWLSSLIFLVSFLILAQGKILSDSKDDFLFWPAFLLLALLGAQFFTVMIWLPFNEMALGLLLTLAILLVYDLLKYFVDSTLVRRRIIVKKIIIYIGLMAILLLLLRWQ